ncbi:MAG: PD-(D/E)XK nuclease family protein [Deltaproteobacteria bacterium]|nr:PD-(D/E)XK nuclease family protein [Deltaproteobacteria bacterium]
MLEETFSHIKSGVPVLTVNARLSRHIAREYDLRMRREGNSLWQTPLILPLASWLERLWESAASGPPLLDGLRAGVLWEKAVLGAVRALPGVLITRGVAQSAYEAYSLLKGHSITLPQGGIYLTEEAKALRKWTAIYEAEVRRLGFIDGPSVVWAVIDLIERGMVSPTPSLVLAGFDELTPAAARLVAALEKNGTEVIFRPSPLPGPDPAVSLPDMSGRLIVRPCADETQEAVQAARWLRSIAGPGVRAGVIVPDMKRYRDIIKREFRAELTPRRILTDGEGDDIFNISLGVPLYEEPLVNSALGVLSIKGWREDILRLSSVLLCPYFACADAMALAGIDAALKEANRLKAGLEDVRALARGGALGARLGEWIAALREAPKKELPGFWAHSFSRFLKRVGWLGSIRLSSREYQAFAAWNGLLEGLSGLDDVLGRISRAEAVSRLASMAKDRIHQPENPDCGIEALGLLESAGIRFDHVWIMGCHERSFPSQPSPNPFIPLHLQKTHGLPHSSHERELWFAKSVLKRLFDGSGAITASYPLKADGKEARLSPLLSGLNGPTAGSGFDATSRLKDLSRNVCALEDMPAEPLIPVSPEERVRLTGGAEIIKNQSLCPFKAFATHRLNAKAIAAPDFGLSERERGSILHTAMKLFWEALGGSEGLKGLKDGGGLDGFVHDLTLRAFTHVNLYPPFSDRFLEMERERCEALLKEWAEVESGREPFAVKMVERRAEIDINGLRINGRLDRVDTVDGGDVVIDYKSGAVNKKDWLTGRPKDPQLLIYSLSGRFDAISFARVVPGECRFIGISSAGDLLPGVAPIEQDRIIGAPGGDWDGLMALWKKTVEDLAAAFLAGVADVDPVEAIGRNSTCAHCDMALFCRVVEMDVSGDADEGNGNGDGNGDG